MALSSSESELLTQTCVNMNIAANTCREVLEMLRNLGNTGVVDIATHNNSNDAHSTNSNLFHIERGAHNDTVFASYKYGAQGADGVKGQRDYWANQIIKSDELNTFGSLDVYSANYYSISKHNLTDSSGIGMSFVSANTNNIKALYYSSHALNDGLDSSKTVSSGIRYYANRSSFFNDSYGINPYSTIGFMVSTGTYGSINDVVNITFPSLYPTTNNTISLGWSGAAWKDIYTVNAVTVTSDRRAKKDIASIGSQAVDFIKALRPVSYKLKQGEGHVDPMDENGNPVSVENPSADREGIRTHWGFIAQEVKEALSTAGYEDAAVWCLADKDDPDSRQSLRYEELIAPMIKAIQQQQERIEALERKVA